MAHPHDLILFLRARYDEEVALAEAASPGPWHPNDEADEVLAADDITVADGFALSGQQLRATTQHIALHDPARVLAETAAKRAVLDAWDDIDYEMPWSVYDALAAVYAGHPDYPR
jgi:hypothetical protein